MRLSLGASLALGLLLGITSMADASTAPASWRADLLGATSPQRSFRMSDRQLDTLLLQDDTAPALGEYGDSGGPPRRWWPVVLSAFVPGLGETVTGHRRGWFMIGADAGLWYAVYDKHQEGEDFEDEFEAFALEHWSEEDWAAALRNGDLQDYFGYPFGTDKDEVPLYVSREEDEREWFENLGKWDVFTWGWDDFDDAGDPDNPDYSTPNRTAYVDLRGKSNDAFDRRDTFVNVAVLFRVFSVVQMAYLEGFVGGRYNAPAGVDDRPRMGWIVEPRPRGETRVGWKVSY